MENCKPFEKISGTAPGEQHCRQKSRAKCRRSLHRSGCQKGRVVAHNHNCFINRTPVNVTRNQKNSK